VLREDCIPADFDLGMVLFSGSLAQEVEASNKKTTTNS
jgi:hypothetical protein